MDSSQQVLQTNGKLFSNFDLMAETRDSEKYSNELRVVNIDQIAMCYISMDSSRQALQTNGYLFSNFRIIFRISYNFSK